MEQLDLYGTVDLAVCTLDSLNHLPGKKALQKALHRLQFFVEPGGLFLFDVNTPYKHREVLGNNCFVRESEALFCVWQNEYTPEEHKVEIQMDFFRRGKGEQYTRDGEQFCEWAWEDEELTAMLEAEHFEVLERWGGYDRAPVMPTTQRMVYVTRRREKLSAKTAKKGLTRAVVSRIITNVADTIRQINRRQTHGPVVQLVRTLACHARGRGFEPHPGRHI